MALERGEIRPAFAKVSRRQLLQWASIGGATTAVAIVVDACGGQAAPTPAAVAAPPTSSPPTPAPAPTTAPAVVPTTAPAAAPSPTSSASGAALPVGGARFSVRKFPGVNLSVLIPDIESTTTAKKHLPDFEKATGMSVTFDIPPYDAHHQKGMLDVSGGSHSYDVLFFDVPWLPEFAATKNILRLEEFVAKEDATYFSDMVPELVKVSGVASDGGLYAIPSSTTAAILVYRKDLFAQEADNYKGATGNELKPATTWREYADQAKFFAKKMNPKSPIDFGVTMAGSRGSGALNMVQPILWGLGGREFNTDFKVTINDEVGIHAFALVTELGKYAQTGVGSAYWDDMYKVYTGGKAAMTYVHHLFAVGNERPDSPIKGKSGYARIPGGANTIGGWTVGINKNSPNRDAAWEFARWVTGPEMALTLFAGGGAAPRTSILNNAKLFDEYPFLPPLATAFKESQNRASPCPTCPGIIPEAQYELQVGAESSAAISGAETPKVAADNSAKIIEKLLKDFGYAK